MTRPSCWADAVGVGWSGRVGPVRSGRLVAFVVGSCAGNGRIAEKKSRMCGCGNPRVFWRWGLLSPDYGGKVGGCVEGEVGARRSRLVNGGAGGKALSTRHSCL